MKTEEKTNEEVDEPKSLKEKIELQKNRLRKNAHETKKQAQENIGTKKRLSTKDKRELEEQRKKEAEQRWISCRSKKPKDDNTNPKSKNKKIPNPKPQPYNINYIIKRRATKSQAIIQDIPIKSKPEQRFPIRQQLNSQPPEQRIHFQEELRFDGDNYLKSATAFNISEGLNLSLHKGANSPLALEKYEDVSFTERLLERNAIANMAKQKRMDLPAKAMTSEERQFMACTFQPNLHTKKAKFSHVRPKLLDHFQDPKYNRLSGSRIEDEAYLRQPKKLNQSYQDSFSSSSIFQPAYPNPQRTAATVSNIQTPRSGNSKNNIIII